MTRDLRDVTIVIPTGQSNTITTLYILLLLCQVIVLLYDLAGSLDSSERRHQDSGYIAK